MRNSSLLIGALFLLGSVFSTSVIAAPNTPAAASSSSADSDYTRRLQRLEEQIVDLNAQIGTIESLSRGGAGGGGAPAGDGVSAVGDDSKLGQMEMEVRTLSAQFGDIVRRLQAIEQRSGIVSPPMQPLGTERNEYAGNGSGRRAPAQPSEQGTGFVVGGDGSASSASGSSTSGSASGGMGTSNSGGASGGFSGSARIEPAPEPQPAPPPVKKKSGGFFNNLFGGEEEEAPAEKPAAQNLQPPTAQQRTPAPGSSGAPVRVASVSSGGAKSVYDAAYAALMERNYRAAAEGFEQFIQRFPSDPMAGSAHFWLGEASFTNGEYRKAADNFLKCTTNYPQSEKAAEGMLKLGISLKRLNEKDAACSSFNELSRRYPDATAILQRAEAEKRRTGC